MDREKSNNIQALRGIAVICIVTYHYACIYAQQIGGKIQYRYFDFGWLTYAVPMFFVLSAMFLYKKAREYNNPLKLIVYRLVRLFPAYWMGVCISFFVRRFLIQDGIGIMDFVVNLTMIEEMLGVSSIDGVYWTMYYELMLLFILTGVIIVGMLIKKPLIDQTDLICSVWLVLGILSQIFMKACGIKSSSIKLILFGSSYISVFVVGLIFCDVYLYGCIISLWKKINILIAFLYEVIFFPFATAGIAVFAVLILFAVMQEKYNANKKLLESKALLRLGSISYPLYLCHRWLGEFFARQVYGEGKYYIGVVVMGIAFLLSVALAMLVSKVEVRMLNHIKKSAWYKRILTA